MTDGQKRYWEEAMSGLMNGFIVPMIGGLGFIAIVVSRLVYETEVDSTLLSACLVLMGVKPILEKFKGSR